MISQTAIVSNIIRARQAFGLSQTDLARRCKLTRDEIDNIEHCKTTISPEVLLQLADGLDCNPCDLLLFISSEQPLNHQSAIADQGQR
jgi:transcriptional regulator with XRE-family HTH domain